MLTGEIQPVLGGEEVEGVDGGALGNLGLLNLAEIDGLRVESDILDWLETFALRMDFPHHNKSPEAGEDQPMRAHRYPPPRR